MWNDKYELDWEIKRSLVTVVTPKEILTEDRLPLGLPPMVMQIGTCTQELD